MRFTKKEHPEQVKQYGHIEPAPVFGPLRCFARCPGTHLTCTLSKRHNGPHVAHGSLKEVTAVWDEAEHDNPANALPPDADNAEAHRKGRMVGTVLLGLLNFLFPGSAMLWRRQSFQAISYCMAFGLLSVFRDDIGALWAIYVFLLAQVHFLKVRKLGEVKDFQSVTKRLIWIVTGLVVVAYCILYGPSWTHGGEIRMPALLFTLVVVALIVPGLILTRYLARMPIPSRM